MAAFWSGVKSPAALSIEPQVEIGMAITNLPPGQAARYDSFMVVICCSHVE